MTLEEIKQKYTKVEKAGRSGYGYHAYLVVDHQSFRICLNTSLERAEWYADQLAKALERIIK